MYAYSPFDSFGSSRIHYLRCKRAPRNAFNLAVASGEGEGEGEVLFDAISRPKMIRQVQDSLTPRRANILISDTIRLTLASVCTLLAPSPCDYDRHLRLEVCHYAGAQYLVFTFTAGLL
jgi:hypothetical protein